MKFKQIWLTGFRGGRLKMLMDGPMHGWTDAQTDGQMEEDLQQRNCFGLVNRKSTEGLKPVLVMQNP